jgi:uncharacterized damage-inducible protein DinB
MKPDEITTLFEYGWWARDRLLATADGMSEEEFARENGFTYKSLRGILVHAMEAESFWRGRFTGERDIAKIGDDELRSVAELTERWAEEESRLRGFLNTLTDEVVNGEFVIRRRSGEERKQPLWQLLVHVVNHGTQHRSEAAEALTMVGRSPGDLDFAAFLWHLGAS